MNVRFAALTAVLLLAAAPASAQGRVSIEELTVDGDPPPEMYRAVLIEGIRPSVEAIRDAYGRRLAERPGLGGDYRLRLWVSNREVVRITPENALGDETMERLTREAIYRFRLPDAAPTGGAWVRFVVRFTPPAGSPATTPPPATPVTPTPPTTPGTPPPLVGATPGATVPSLRAPTVRVDRITGALAESAVESVVPLPQLTRCLTSPRGGTLRMVVSIDRRGRITATPGTGTFRHRASITCMEQAIESLTPGASAGPSRLRLTFTIPAAP